MNIVSGLILVLWLWLVFSKQLKKEVLELHRVFIIAGFILLLPLINSIDLKLALRTYISTFIKYSIVFLAGIEVIDTNENFKKVIMSFMASSIIVILYSFYSHFILKESRRLMGVFNNPNSAGAFILILATLSTGAILFAKKKVIIYTGFVFFFMSITLLIYTYSRGAWLGYLSAITIFLFLFFKKWDILSRKGIAILFLLLLLLIFIMPGDFVERFRSIDDFQSGSIQQRLMQYRSSWEIIKDHPLVGIGWGQFPLRFQEYKSDKAKIFDHVHNLYIHFVAETGIIGLLSVLYIFYRVLVKKFLATARKSRLIYVFAGVFIASAVHNIFDVTFLYSQIGLILILIAAIWYNFIEGDINQL